MKTLATISAFAAFAVFGAQSDWVRPDLLSGPAPSAPSELQHRIPADRQRIAAMVDRAADAAGVPRDVAHYHVKRESGYRPAAKNPASTAKGLLQVIHGTHEIIAGRRMSRAEHFARMADPTEGLRVGLAHIRACMDAMPGAGAQTLYRCHYHGHAHFGGNIRIASTFYKAGNHAWSSF